VSSSFVTFLIDHGNDRAMRAALRRGLGKAEGHPAMYPYVVPFLGDAKDMWRYFTVAALFGAFPEHEEGVSFGKALGKLERNDSLKKRFTWLLDATIEELPMRLKSMVSLLKSKHIAFDYYGLFKDLSNWDSPKHFVQLNWAEDFYRIENENQNKE